MHPMGNILATTSGQKHFKDYTDMGGLPSTPQADSSLDVWLLPCVSGSTTI